MIRKICVKSVLTLVWITSTVLLTAGCGKGTMDNMNIHPPTRGLISYLKQDSMANVSDNGYKVRLAYGDSAIAAGIDRKLRIQVLSPAGTPVRIFSEDMTKLLHMIVVSRDLSFFEHVHPEYEGDGSFTVSFRFPASGDYLLIHEFKPETAGITVHKQWIRVSGARNKESPPVPDTLFHKKSGDVSASLSAIPAVSELKAGQMVMLDFRFADAVTGEPIVLEPYLGTAGHAVILDDRADRYVHVHAVSEMSSASDVMFHAQFPAAGTYKIWGQFQYRQKPLIVPFVVQIN